MFDIGFWELLVIAVVLLLVMGPERLPEVAKQAAFLVRKARQGMYRLRSEMQSEIDATPFADLQQARQEMTEFKNDIKQFGRDLANSAEEASKAVETEISEAEKQLADKEVQPESGAEQGSGKSSENSDSKESERTTKPSASKTE